MVNKKILLVDDSNTIIMMEKMFLRKDHYEICVARDGAEAVEIAQKEQPDLILLDIRMPIMDGFEACKKLKSGKTTKNIPVIMITTRGEEDNIEKAYACGCTEYITKPFTAIELLTKLKNCL